MGCIDLFFRRSVGSRGPAASIDSRGVRLLSLVVDIGSGTQLPPTAVDSRADGRCGGTDVVHHDGPDRGVVAAKATRPKHRVGGQCGCARRSGGSAGVDDASGQPLGLAMGFFYCRHSGTTSWLLDLEIREGTFRKRGDNLPEAICERVFFHPALPQYLAMLSGRDRVHVMVIRAERICAAVHHGGGS